METGGYMLHAHPNQKNDQNYTKLTTSLCRTMSSAVCCLCGGESNGERKLYLISQFGTILDGDRGGGRWMGWGGVGGGRWGGGAGRAVWQRHEAHTSPNSFLGIIAWHLGPFFTNF